MRNTFLAFALFTFSLGAVAHKCKIKERQIASRFDGGIPFGTNVYDVFIIVKKNWFGPDDKSYIDTFLDLKSAQEKVKALKDAGLCS